MSVGRYHFALVLLPSGDILAPGGVPSGGGIWTREVDLLSASTSTFVQITSMPTSHRYWRQAVLLNDGRVLIAGEHYDSASSRSHLYDADTLSWTEPVNHPQVVRFGAAMTLLPDGKVLYTGGYNGGAGGPTYPSAELFDPISSTWSTTGSMAAERLGHSSNLLTTGPHAGKVLVCGGGRRIDESVEKRCELYDPAAGTFALTGPMSFGRTIHTATTLDDGRVLVTGGSTAGFNTANLASAEIYDPAAGTWTLVAPMAERRALHTATLLENGEVLVVGGARNGNLLDVVASAEIYRPSTNSWRPAPVMSTARTGHSALRLADGNVLVAGGRNASSIHPSTSIFVTDLLFGDGFESGNTLAWVAEDSR
jgi:hypothetical protein